MAISYQKAIKILNNRQKRKIDNNTYLERIDDIFIVRFHNTDIIKIFPDNTQVIFIGGYKTATTKKRISDYSFVDVYQRNYEWFFGDGEEFTDGMKVNCCGQLIE